MAHGLQHRGIATKLRKAWTTIKGYCHKWRIKLNETKTEAILFPVDGKKKRRPPNDTVDIRRREAQVEAVQISTVPANEPPNAQGQIADDDLAIEGIEELEPDLHYSRVVKYLGVIFDQKLLFADHLKVANTKAIGIISALYPLPLTASSLYARNYCFTSRSYDRSSRMHPQCGPRQRTVITNRYKLHRTGR